MTGIDLAVEVVKSFQFLRTKNCCQEIKEMVQTYLPKTIKPMKRKVPHHLSGSTTAVRCAQTRNLASQDFRVATAKGFEWILAKTGRTIKKSKSCQNWHGVWFWFLGSKLSTSYSSCLSKRIDQIWILDF